MVKYFSTILFSCVCTVVTWTAHAKADLGKIIILGDSLTEGYGIEKAKAYPTLLEAKLQKSGYKVEVVNAGISGSTSASGPSRFKWLLRAKPDWLILALGGNDGLRGLPIEEMRRNLTKVIVLAKEADVRVVLAGIRIPPNYGPEYTKSFFASYETLAKTHGVEHIPFLMQNVGGEKELMQPDGVHPNIKGHEQMAETVFQWFKQHVPVTTSQAKDTKQSKSDLKSTVH